MLVLSKDMARVLQANSRSRNSDSAEVAEDLESLRDFAAAVICRDDGRVPNEDFADALGIEMPRPAEDGVKSKGTRSQNRANRFRKAAGIANLVEATKDNPSGHYRIARTEPALDLQTARMKMDAEQIGKLLPPFNLYPFGWIMISFTESGIDAIKDWGSVNDEVEEKIDELVAEYEAAKDAEVTESESSEVHDEPVVTENGAEDVAPTGKRKVS